jgi:sporulation protein YlmC with PRC-barrel domain
MNLVMLKLYETVPEIKVMSLRTGTPIGTVEAAIINPNNLYIEGWFVTEGRKKDKLILLSNDIRDALPQGFAVNDREVLTPPEELIRLKEVLDLNFRLLHLKVVSENGKSYGKVSDFAFETSNFFIQKIYASQSIVKNFSGGPFSIDRSQIIEVTNRKIVIEDPSEKARSRATSPSPVG